MSKIKVISIILIFILVSTCFIFNYNTGDYEKNTKDINLEIINNPNKSSQINLNSDSRSSHDTPIPRKSLECNIYGGCWLDSFIDDSGIEVDTNCISEYRNIRISSQSIEFIDNYNGVDGTFITSYDSNYDWGASGTGGTRRIEIDSGQKFEGQSSVLLYIHSSSKYSYWFNRSVNYVSPIIDVNYYIRLAKVGVAYSFFLHSNNDVITLAGIYGGAGNICYQDGSNYEDSGKRVIANRWYKVNTILYKIDGEYSTYDFTIWDTTNMQTPIVSKTALNVATSGYSKIDDFKVNIGNVWDRYMDCWFDGLTINRTDYEAFGSIQSKPITIPQGMVWDTLFINKTQPQGTYLNVTILNASNNQPIPGAPVYVDDGEFDISYLDTAKYPSIKLKALFESNDISTPILHTWGVSWNATNTWQDTLFGGLKVGSKSDVNIINGEARFPNAGLLRSTTIDIPEDCYYSTLIINKSATLDIPILVSVLDAQTNFVIQGYDDLADSEIDLTALNPLIYPAIKLQATTSDESSTPLKLYDWSVNWTSNTAPKILDITSIQMVNRTLSAKIYVNLTDSEELENDLILQVEYKARSDTTWQDSYLIGPNYINDRWECTFTPTAKADFGYYSFRITCYDFFQYFDQSEYLDLIKVINNHPTPPEVSILPIGPRTNDDLIIFASKSTDIETTLTKLVYWYHWYKDDLLIPELNNQTTIPRSLTAKGERWQCEVYAFDGDNYGAPADAEVIISNTPPDRLVQSEDIKMFEDNPITLEDKLSTYFTDVDDDTLNYSATGFKNINIIITQTNGTIQLIPAENWYGREIVTFSANDSESNSEVVTVQMDVKPTNDLPEIIQVGNKNTYIGYPELNFTVDEDQWLNLSITATDLDGALATQKIKYSVNITHRNNLYLDQDTLIFNPHNEDVGVHYLEISITDGNETPLEFIDQRIRIRVINVNDPPTVKITSPETGKEIHDDAKFSLICNAEDVDLLTPNPTEIITYRWYAINSDSGETIELGSERELSNQTLPIGHYTITVEIEDNNSTKAYDSINIVVKEAPRDPTMEIFGLYSWLFVLIVIIIIILISLMLLILNKKKKQKLEKMDLASDKVLQPVAAYRPDTRLTAAPSIGAGEQLSRPQVAVLRPFVSPPRTQPTAQLPPIRPVAQPQVQDKTKIQEQSLGIDSRLSPQEKIALLEERLVKGEIDEGVYLNLKAKFEMEARRFQPTPQLPPVTAPTSPIPTVAQPKPTPPSIPTQVNFKLEMEKNRNLKS